MNQRLVTQKEIAEQLGVSVATVSRALNDQPGVSPKVRAEILEAARQMGYSPDTPGRSLVTGRTHNIGYIGYKHGADLPLVHTLRGIDEELGKLGYHMLVTYVDEEAMKKPDMLSMIRQRKVDGLILNGPAIHPRFILELRNMGLPIVLIDNRLNETMVDCVLCDNEDGAYQAVGHLIEHGHEHIVFLSGPADWLSSRERAAGYRRALQEAGLKSHIVFMPNTIVDTGYEAMLSALEKHPDLTAVMAVNDAMAVGAIRACQQVARAVPGDVAVVGFDDGPLVQVQMPPLTTVHVYWRKIGIQAARRVVDLIEQDDRVPMQMRLAVELVIRQSCGCHTTSKTS